MSPKPYNLMLFMPPRHSKSEICARRLPGFIYGHNPDAQIIFTTYGMDLSGDMSRDVQGIMLSESYHELFPYSPLKHVGYKCNDTAIKQAKGFTIVGKRGKYRATGVGGGITGTGADYAIIDDPHKNRKEAESKTVRDGIKAWYRSTLRTRLEKGGRILLLQTRWHIDDLAGWLIKEAQNNPDGDKWKIVSLPAVYENTEFTHPKDPRSEGEALWPNKYNADALNKIKVGGSYDWNALYQQRPESPTGARIKREWLKVIEAAPDNLQWVRYWDLAVTKKTTADYTASGQMAIDIDGNIYVRKLVHEQQEWPTSKRMITLIARQECVSVGIESVATQKGFVDDLIADPMLREIDIRGYGVDSEKLVRALPWIGRAEQGKFFIIRGKGADEYIEELVEFTGHEDAHDDQVDWTSGAYKMLAEYVEPEMIVAGDYAFA